MKCLKCKHSINSQSPTPITIIKKNDRVVGFVCYICSLEHFGIKK